LNNKEQLRGNREKGKTVLGPDLKSYRT